MTRWLRTIPNLHEHGLRVAFARSELYSLSLGESADALNDACMRAEQSDQTARLVVSSFVPVVVDVEHLDRTWSVRATANAAQLMSAGRFLRATTPEGHHIDQRSGHRLQNVMQRADGKPLSLGERRALARRPSRKTLDLLMKDPHPMVARIVLGNPRITEDDVVRMAAYRPAMARVAAEIAIAWSRSTRVRMSLVLNPGVPPGISVPMLPLLVRPELHQVVRAVDLPAVTRATAQELFELRPPMPQRDPPAMKH